MNKRSGAIFLILFKCMVFGLHAQQDTSALMQEITISGDREIYHAGEVKILKSQFMISPASFQDPTRALIRFPGLSVQNDQSNEVIYHGLPPSFISWRLNGIPIINPNHLSNAGIPNDLGSTSGGGVNAFNGNILRGLDFNPGSTGVEIGNIAGGNANLLLKEELRSYIDLNLIGIEAGYGFSYGKEKNLHAYVSGRNSFVGLLNQLGVDFGGEEINYRDISYKIDLLKYKKFSIKTFGLIGNSTNQYNHIPLDREISIEKEAQDIHYKSNLHILGSSLNWVGKSTSFNSSIGISKRNDIRSSEYYRIFQDSVSSVVQASELNSFCNKFSVAKEKNTFSFGLDLLQYKAEYNVKNESRSLFYTYAIFENNSIKELKISGGIGLASSSNLNYHLSMKSNLSGPMVFALLYRKSTFKSDVSSLTNDIPFSNVSSISGQIKYQVPSFQIEINPFYSHFNQLEYKLPYHFMDLEGAQYLHVFNLGSGYGISEQLDNGATVMNYGLDFKMDATVNVKDWSVVPSISISIFDVKPKDNGISQTTVYNTKYNLSASIAIQYDPQTLVNNKKYIFSLAYHQREGLREFGYMGDQIDYVSGLTNQLQQYSRLDMRLLYAYVKYKGVYRNRISLDIQNVLNHQNEGWSYYDHYQERVLVQKQLGLVPVLSFRRDF